MNAEISAGTLRYANREGLSKVAKHHGTVPSYIQQCQLKNRELQAKPQILDKIKTKFPRIHADQEAHFGLAMYLSDEAFSAYRAYAREHGIVDAYLWQIGKRFKKA